MATFKFIKHNQNYYVIISSDFFTVG